MFRILGVVLLLACFALANQDFENEDEEEEWYNNIGLKVEEYNNLDWVDIIIDERKK